MSSPVLFPIPPDWTKDVKETTSYLTDVLVAYSDAEQRRGLRANPRRSLGFPITTTSSRETALLEAILFGSMQNPFALPWWPDALRLSSDLPSGSTAIPLDPSTRLFASGGLAAIWRNAFDNELVSVANVDGSGLTLASGTANDWTANDCLVLPAFLARLASSVDVTRYSSGGIMADFAFSGEAGQVAPAGSWSPEQYLGIDVLEVSPNWTQDSKRTIARSLIVLDSKTGDVTVETKGSSPISAAPIQCFLADRAEVDKFRAFLDRRKGRLVPFFAPSWNQDLILASDVLATDSTIRVDVMNYTRFLFPSPSRRDIAFLAVTGERVYTRILNSVQNSDGTETLTLAAPIGTAFRKDRTQISFLELVRLATDDVDLSWSSSTFAMASLPTVEVPREVPA